MALCHPGQFLHSLAAGQENLRVSRVARYRRRQRHACRQHGIDYRTFLRGKTEKTIQIDRCTIQRVAFCQPVAQMRQTVARIGQRLVAQAFVGSQQLCKIGQFLTERRILALRRGREQRLRRDGARFAFIDEPQRLL